MRRWIFIWGKEGKRHWTHKKNKEFIAIKEQTTEVRIKGNLDNPSRFDSYLYQRRIKLSHLNRKNNHSYLYPTQIKRQGWTIIDHWRKRKQRRFSQENEYEPISLKNNHNREEREYKEILQKEMKRRGERSKALKKIEMQQNRAKEIKWEWEWAWIRTLLEGK